MTMIETAISVFEASSRKNFEAASLDGVKKNYELNYSTFCRSGVIYSLLVLNFCINSTTTHPIHFEKNRTLSFCMVSSYFEHRQTMGQARTVAVGMMVLELACNTIFQIYFLAYAIST